MFAHDFQSYWGGQVKSAKKVLDSACAGSMLTLPSFNAPRQKPGRKKQNPRVLRLLVGAFPEQSGKVLTTNLPVALVDLFPSWEREFFEIYFVRLIGTPNQPLTR